MTTNPIYKHARELVKTNPSMAYDLLEKQAARYQSDLARSF